MLQRDQQAVLVVEDEAIIRMMITDEFVDAGFIAYEAGDAAEALDLLEAHPEVSILFTDINMPGAMNGVDLARAAQVRRPGIKLYLASGRERPDADELPNQGVFIEKPYNVRNIAQLIRETV